MCGCIQAAIYAVPGFDAAVHTGYDLMQAVAGVMKDTFVGILMSKRYTEVVEQHEAAVHKRFGRRRPWELSAEDIQVAKEVLQLIASVTDSRVTGSRFARLLAPGESKKSHAMHVLASPYGECLLCCTGGASTSPVLINNTTGGGYRALLAEHTTFIGEEAEGGPAQPIESL